MEQKRGEAIIIHITFSMSRHNNNFVWGGRMTETLLRIYCTYIASIVFSIYDHSTVTEVTIRTLYIKYIGTGGAESIKNTKYGISAYKV